MKIAKNIKQYYKLRKELGNKKVGFVATMGALHIGHASLIKQSTNECEMTVLSIFINKTQFNNQSDLDNYPNTLDKDLQLAEDLGVDLVFVPDYKEMFADNYRYQLNENEVSKRLCGKAREGHFNGVLTVVMKLLNIVKPNRAYFGKKDYQQFRLIDGMVKAFFMDMEMVACDTVREQDGLAYSSRNILLTEDDRKLAPQLHQLITSEQSDVKVYGQLQKMGFVVDYVETIDDRRYAAASLGKVRLIDNVEKEKVAL